MINLPHQAPIKFVKNILEKDLNSATVTCSFPTKPTLAMVCEASAQSTIVFSKGDKPQNGFLISLKNVEQLESLDSNDYIVKVEESFNFGNMTEYNFELADKSKLYVKGSLTILVDN